MLKQASIQQIRNGGLTRAHGHLVVAMRFYPRGLRKDLRDEYRADLAPDRALLADFKHFQRTHGHQAAFELSHYEERFTLTDVALAHLRELSFIARKKDVYFACQCAPGEMCHREILLLIAQRVFAAPAERTHHRYERFLARLSQNAASPEPISSPFKTTL